MSSDELSVIKELIANKIGFLYLPRNILRFEVELYECKGYSSFNFRIETINEDVRNEICNLLLKESILINKCINIMIYYDSFWHYTYFLQLNIREKIGGNWILREDELNNAFNYYSNYWISLFYTQYNIRIHDRLNNWLKYSINRSYPNLDIYKINFNNLFELANPFHNLKEESEFNYELINHNFIINYTLPNEEYIPVIKRLSFIKKDILIKEINHRDSYIHKLYNSIIYQITFSCIYHIFNSTNDSELKNIVFNGYIHNKNKATGQEQRICILSIQTDRKEFKNIDLRYIEPEECFKRLKGISCAKISTITPIAPIALLNKEDSRFVDSKEIYLQEYNNLAKMDWEDFEQLIRQIFEKEFNVNGGEVKITQASRDGGVDAIAFDPDPIKGGKIVIQAKRYNNTVGVSAVRDLYGTVLNEGANKGILVTTSNYGSDSYSFAKGKPLTLLNGANLLSLLEKHGQKAKIELKSKL